jgi:hypothetical protein
MMPDYPKPPFASPRQPMPGSTEAMQPRPYLGVKCYKGSGRNDGSGHRRQALHLTNAPLKHSVTPTADPGWTLALEQNRRLFDNQQE